MNFTFYRKKEIWKRKAAAFLFLFMFDLNDLVEKMKIKYSTDADVLHIIFSDNPIAESDEEKPGMILDYDKVGSVVSIEILDASLKMNPAKVEYEIA